MNTNISVFVFSYFAIDILPPFGYFGLCSGFTAYTRFLGTTFQVPHQQLDLHTHIKKDIHVNKAFIRYLLELPTG